MTPVQQLFSSLMSISTHSSKKEKESILGRLRSIPEGKKFFELATDPFGNYWITIDLDNVNLTFSGTNDAEKMTERFSGFVKLCQDLKGRAVTGDASVAAVHTFLSSCGNVAPYHEVRWYVAALNKHLNIGVAGKIISQVWPDLVSDFAVPLAESLYEQTTGAVNQDVYDFVDAHFPLTQEPKYDGANGSVVSAGLKAAVSSRAEGLWPVCMRWQQVFTAALKNISARTKKDLSEWVLNGEFKATLRDDDPKTWSSSWGKTVAMIHAGLYPTGYDPTRISPHLQKCFRRGDLEYIVYDTYPYASYATGKWDVSYGHRSIPGTRSWWCALIVAEMKRLDPRLPVRHTEQKIVKNWDEVHAYHAELIDQGHEGSMLKLHLPCVLDRTSQIVKYKEYEYLDAVVLYVNQGTNSNKDKGGTYTAYFPSIDDVVDVTIRTNALKSWSWENKLRLPGFRIETAQQKDKKSVAKARNPTLVRPRVDAPPMPIHEVDALCRRFKLPVPENQQMAFAAFKQAIASFKL